MHICLICNEYPPAVHGGIGTFSQDLATGLAKEGHQVTVVGVYTPVSLELSGTLTEHAHNVKVVRIPSLSRVPPRLRGVVDRLRLTQWLKRLHKEDPFDLVECPEYDGWIAFGGPKRTPVIVRLHGSVAFFSCELKRPYSRQSVYFEKRSTARADHILSVSDYLAEVTLKMFNLNDRRSTTIYNAVNAEMLYPSASVSIERGLIVFANTVSPRKGVIELVSAMDILLRTHPYAQLVIIGKNHHKMPDGTPFSDFALKHVDAKYREHITFTGWISRQEVLDILSRANVCCYPSHSEGFGIAPVEAMAMRKPTVFMSHGPGPEVIEDGVSGLLCNTYSPEDIAEKITRILDNPQLAARLGENARNRVLQRFNKQDWIDENVDFYKSCLNNYRSRL